MSRAAVRLGRRRARPRRPGPLHRLTRAHRRHLGGRVGMGQVPRPPAVADGGRADTPPPPPAGRTDAGSRREQASRDEGRLQRLGGPAVAGQPVLDLRVHEHAVAHDRVPGDDRVPGADRSAPEPRLDGVADRAGERHALERPAHEVADRADRQLAELALAAEAAGRTTGGDLRARRGPRSTSDPCAGGRAAGRCGPPSRARPSRSTPSRRSPARPARPRRGTRPPGRCRHRRSSCCCSGSGRRRCPTGRGGRSRPRSDRCSAPPTRDRCPSRPPRSARSGGRRRSPGRTCPRRGPRRGGCAAGRRAARPARPSPSSARA